MALPSLKDLLPDHLFHYQATSLPPPPPSTILHNLPPPTQPLSSHYGGFSPHPYPRSQPPLMALYPHSRPPAASFAPSQGRIFDRQADNYRGAALSDVYSSTSRVADSSNNSIDTSFRHTSPQPHATENEIEEAGNDDLGGDGEKRKHECSMCGKRFNRPSSLRIHLNTHTGAKPYVCPFPGCNRQFNVSSNMRRHYRNHARRAPPPLPLNDVLAQAEAAHAQAQTQLQIQMHNQMQAQRAFSIEQPSHMQPRQSVPSEVKPPNAQWNADETANMVHGKETAARAARRLSIPLSSVPVADPISAARQSASTIARSRPPVQYEYPYPHASSHSNSAHSNGQPTSRSHPHNHSAYLQNSSQSTDLLAGREYSYPAYPTTRHRAGSVPETDSNIGNLAPLSSSHVVVPLSSRTTRTNQGSRYTIPPTPPYTSEAALSPQYTTLPGLPPDTERRDLSYYGPERDQDYTATVHERENLRNSGHQTDHTGLALCNRDADRLTRYGGGDVRSMSPARAHAAPSLCSEQVGDKLDEHLPHYASYSSSNEGDYQDAYPRLQAHTYPRECYARMQDSLCQHDDSGYISATQSTGSHVPDARAIILPATSRQSTEKTHNDKAVGVIQQLSPDTPSLHVSALNSQHPYNDDTHVIVGADKHGPVSIDSTRKEQESFAAGTAEKTSFAHARGTSRSSLLLHDLINPVEQLPATQMTRSPADQPICTNTKDSEMIAEKSTGTPVERTPGAAPPPPYPLYTLPPAAPESPYSDPEKIDNFETEDGGDTRIRRKRTYDVPGGERAERCSRGSKKRRRG